MRPAPALLAARPRAGVSFAAADAAAGGPLHVFLVAAEPSGRSSGRGAHECAAPTDGRCDSPASAGRRCAQPDSKASFPTDDLHIIGFAEVVEAPALSVPKDSRNGRRRRRVDPRLCGHHRQPRLHASRGEAACARPRPGIPIVDYVCPQVWAWRPWRARAMRGYLDHVLALLPFEPAFLARHGGPHAAFVGHPLAQQIR